MIVLLKHPQAAQRELTEVGLRGARGEGGVCLVLREEDAGVVFPDPGRLAHHILALRVDPYVCA